MAVGSITCAQCEAENPKSNRFCDSCGAKLVKVEDSVVPAGKGTKVPAPKLVARPREDSVEPMLARNGIIIDTNMIWMLLILGLGVFLRLWDLGAKPLHHDESIHAWYAFKLFKGPLTPHLRN